MREEEKKLSVVADKLKASRPSLTVECKVEQALEKPVDSILDVARRTEADLIAMGTHGRTGLLHLALGSVAEAVIRRATCPVLVTKAAR
jgi:nucleotide-binding universal stress UspA family protein